MCTGVGKRQNEFASGCVEVEQHPIVFNVAVAKSFKVAGIQKGLTPLQLPHFSSGRQRLIGRSRTLDMIVSPSVSMPDVVQNIGVTVNEDQNRSQGLRI